VLDPYLGLWRLDPDTSDSSARAGFYTLLHDEDGLYGHVRWHDEHGAVHQTAFRSSLDGAEHAMDGAPGLTVSGRVDEAGLVTEVHHEGRVLARAVRTVLDDGAMRVVQGREEGTGWEEQADRYVRTSAKQVLVYRRDLKMRKGKIAAQCAHGAMAVLLRRRTSSRADRVTLGVDGPMSVWLQRGFKKIVLSCEDEAALLTIAQHAGRLGIPNAVITDAGHTEFHGVPTRTVVALGPAATDEIDLITGPNGAVACKLA
jgi:PTH2 family peptidyl-tRNA hydrolase